MVMAYNIAATHRLEPISGFDEISHLQCTAPMDTTVLSMDNGSGEEPGLPSGSVVSLKSNGELTSGAVGTAMPLFLLWNTASIDASTGSLTANGQNLAGIPANSAGQAGNPVSDSAALIRNLYTTDSNGIVTNTSGGANIIQRVVSNGVASYSIRGSVGSYTCWPATCGLELSTTEFDFSETETNFAPNTLLTSPAPDTSVTILSTDTAAVMRQKYQKRRGGYLKIAATSAAPASGAYHNICGTVRKPIESNENNVKVLHFWAERTLVPQSGLTYASVAHTHAEYATTTHTHTEYSTTAHTHDETSGAAEEPST